MARSVAFPGTSCPKFASAAPAAALAAPGGCESARTYVTRGSFVDGAWAACPPARPVDPYASVIPSALVGDRSALPGAPQGRPVTQSRSGPGSRRSTSSGWCPERRDRWHPGPHGPESSSATGRVVPPSHRLTGRSGRLGTRTPPGSSIGDNPGALHPRREQRPALLAGPRAAARGAEMRRA